MGLPGILLASNFGLNVEVIGGDRNAFMLECLWCAVAFFGLPNVRLGEGEFEPA